MCLVETDRDHLARRSFKTKATLSSQGRKYELLDGLVDCGCSGAYVVLNERLVPKICDELQLQPMLLSKPKPLRGLMEN